ncbi:hypothetical protein ASE14_18205 [Agromyces sp. Root81]|uniref:hypothetical protein n=1 Tax=Agromyces sp. Root81 TaxID=1736601 RepID=UPI0006FBFD62|nr:hypothetical protein [Agromyces sp. Root81]KRC58514.1 hypothetical protein ASE14_18205 [Agromyces sp. Root81]
MSDQQIAGTTIGRQFRRPSRSARAAGDVRDSHGGRRLATGITIASGFIVIGHLAHAMMIAPLFPPGPGPWPAWLALVGVVVVGVVSRLVSRNTPLPDVLYVVLLIALIAPVWLDVSATAGLLHLGVTPTAAAAAGAVLMPVAAIRGTRVPLLVSCAIGAVIAGSALLQITTAGHYTVTGLAVAASAVLPMVVAVIAISGFRRLVRRELDLSLVQSTVATPRTAVGMRASEELAQLDFDAESLLDDVGSGRIAIPLPPEAAERAGDLAARLRVRLIEGRNDTWLRHAVTESAYLSNRVTVDDPGGLAGLLEHDQRDGLLLALWFLVGEQSKGTAELAAHVTCREAGEVSDPRSPDVQLSIDVSGVVQRRVDPATWDALGTVGTHDVVTGPESFRIDIDCRVDPNVSAGVTTVHGAARRRGS